MGAICRKLAAILAAAAILCMSFAAQAFVCAASPARARAGAEMAAEFARFDVNFAGGGSNFAGFDVNFAGGEPTVACFVVPPRPAPRLAAPRLAAPRFAGFDVNFAEAAPCAAACSRARLPQGACVGGVDVGGMTLAQGAAAVAAVLDARLAGYALTVRAGERAYVFRPPQVYWKADIAAALLQALGGGEAPLAVRLCLAGEEGALAGICAGAYRRPADASAAFCPNAREPFRFTAERAGQYIDGAALRAAVEDALARGAREAEAPLLPLSPRRTLAEVKKGAALLASFTTYYAEGGSRAHNIALAASRLNGCVLAAGEVLSFNARAGARTAQNGYRAAPVIVRGEFAEGVGGGVCQVSTTLYNAALLAGLSVAEVHPHSLAVGYVPPSRDAMVSGSSCDLKVKNTSRAPAYILARAEGGALTVQVYGRESAVTYAIESEVTARIPPPPPEVRAGAAATIRAAKEGVRSEAYLVRREAGRPSVRVRLRQDSYAPVRAILQRPDPDNTENPAASGEPGA